jgi:hypothetical protein
VQDYVSLMTSSEIQRGAPWKATLGYVHATDNLGLTRLDIPLVRNDESLTFRRTRLYGFLPLLTRDGKAAPLTDNHEFLTPDTKIIDENFVENLALSAGYDLTAFPTDPRAVRQHLAEILDQADALCYEETVTLPTDADILLQITRTNQKIDVSDAPSSHYGSLIPSRQMRRSKRSPAPREPHYSDLVTTDLTAAMEFISRDAAHRRQVLVSFAGQGFTIDLPEIRVVDLEHNLFGLADRGDRDAYDVVNSIDITCDQQALSKLIDSTIETVTGR